MRVVVVGYGMAGVRVADELRRRGAEVTVFAAEPHRPYNRILLPSLLAGKARERDVALPEPSGVELRTGVAATAIDPAGRTVTGGDGTAIRYDALVLATGSRPWYPPVTGLTGEDGGLVDGAVAFRTLDDCRAILSAPARRAVVLGGGLLGLEAARGLAQRGLTVDLVHAAGHLMERQLDPDAGAVLAATVRGFGIGVHLDAHAATVVADARVRGVVLGDGTSLAADLLVLACGVRPDTTLAASAGLTTATGVVVDDALRTSDRHVYAIGDCAEHDGQVYGLVAPAWDQARVVAEVATGGEARYPGSRLVTRLKAAGVDLAVLGDTAHRPDPDAGTIGFTDSANGTYQKVVVRDGRVTGAILLGDNPTVGSLIRLYDRNAPVPTDRRALLLAGATDAGQAAGSPARIPDGAVVCRCNAVTKGAVTKAWLDGARTADEIVAATRAGTGCGTCRDTVAGICDWLAAADATPQATPGAADATPQAAPGAADATPPPDRTARSWSPSVRGGHPASTVYPKGDNLVTQRLVVVGNGMVSQRFVEALTDRDTGRAWQVTVLGEEPRPGYDRVALSSFFDGASPADLSLADERWYAERGVTLHLGVTATAVDRTRKVVTAATGEYPYDALVLATGSYPFVPPVPGHDLPGCFTYRTLDDLERIRRYAHGKRTGAVVGGGLLGLEAANALRLLGLTTHIVEYAPRLMPLQVDDAGAQILTQHVTGLGLHVHVGARSDRLEPGRLGRVARMTLARGAARPDGSATPGIPPEIDVDVVVFAAGVRPRDELGRGAGLQVAEPGGVLVDQTCRTSDEDIYAIGEVAAVEGRCYGLVAPGYAMAEVVADRLVGGDATFPGADTSTKLKLLGVDVASFGDAFGTGDGALDVVYTDPVGGTYAKLVVSDDAKLLRGGILVGNVSAYPTLRASLDQPLAGTPLELLGAGPTGGQAGATALPGTAQVCSCHAVTKDAITAAIAEHDCSDVAAVKACTRAGTGCGSCVPLLKSILAESGVAISRALCEHFGQSRQELFDIIRVRGIATFSELIDGYGTGRGCDICKPAVASILASQGNGHILDGEQAALQDTNDHVLANLQRNGTYSVVPRIPGGEVTPEKLIVIGEVAREFGLYTKITGGQRIDLFGARIEQLPAIWRRLVDAGFESGHAYGKALRTVKSCVGSTWCRYGVQDSVGMAIKLELRYRGLRAPHKIKCAVSGCARECAEARSKDVGVIATENGWNLYVAGNGGFTPRHADLFAADLSEEELTRCIDRFLMFYIRTADRMQRTAAWLESLDGGLDHLREVIVDDSLGLCAELDAAMARHVDGYADEWAGVLGDPEKLRRFSTFVNAPDTPDPSIRFVTERGQPVPLIAGPRLEARGGPPQAIQRRPDNYT